MNKIHSQTPIKNQRSDQLMAAFMDGKTEAFYQLVTEWKGPMVNYFYHQTQLFPLAEDLAQEVFIRVYRTKKYNRQGYFSAWIYRIAQNILRDHLRQHAVPAISGSEFPELLDISSSAKPQADVLLEQEQQNMIYETLNNLPAEEQDLLVLSQIQGVTYQELADLSQVSLSVIKGKIYRAMQRFIKRYREVNHDPI